MAKGDAARAAEALTTHRSPRGHPVRAHVSSPDLRLQLGDTARAADALENAMYMNHSRSRSTNGSRPVRDARRSGQRRAGAPRGRRPGAGRPRGGALSARAGVSGAGNAREARRSVVRSLEDAPNFERAQELLLALHENDGRKP